MNESSRFEGLIHGDHITIQDVQDAKTLATGCVGVVQITAPDISRAPLAGDRGEPSPSEGQVSRDDRGPGPWVAAPGPRGPQNVVKTNENQ